MLNYKGMKSRPALLQMRLTGSLRTAGCHVSPGARGKGAPTSLVMRSFSCLSFFFLRKKKDEKKKLPPPASPGTIWSSLIIQYYTYIYICVCSKLNSFFVNGSLSLKSKVLLRKAILVGKAAMRKSKNHLMSRVSSLRCVKGVTSDETLRCVL